MSRRVLSTQFWLRWCVQGRRGRGFSKAMRFLMSYLMVWKLSIEIGGRDLSNLVYYDFIPVSRVPPRRFCSAFLTTGPDQRRVKVGSGFPPEPGLLTYLFMCQRLRCGVRRTRAASSAVLLLASLHHLYVKSYTVEMGESLPRCRFCSPKMSPDPAGSATHLIVSPGIAALASVSYRNGTIFLKTAKI